MQPGQNIEWMRVPAGFNRDWPDLAAVVDKDGDRSTMESSSDRRCWGSSIGRDPERP